VALRPYRARYPNVHSRRPGRCRRRRQDCGRNSHEPFWLPGSALPLVAAESGDSPLTRRSNPGVRTGERFSPQRSARKRLILLVPVRCRRCTRFSAAATIIIFQPGIGTRIFLVAALAAAIVFGIPALRVQALSAAGLALVESDPTTPADIIVITTDAGRAGVLEAADLVTEGISSRVALFASPPSLADREFIRRGVPYLDVAAIHEQLLHSLGIREVERIARPVSGTEDEGAFLPG
jgi:hypothetical protein